MAARNKEMLEALNKPRSRLHGTASAAADRHGAIGKDGSCDARRETAPQLPELREPAWSTASRPDPIVGKGSALPTRLASPM